MMGSQPLEAEAWREGKRREQYRDACCPCSPCPHLRPLPHPQRWQRAALGLLTPMAQAPCPAQHTHPFCPCFLLRSSIKSGIGELLACQSIFILYLCHCWGHFTSVKASDYRHKQGGKEKVGECRHSQFPSPCITGQAGCPRMSVLGFPLLVTLATGLLPSTMGAAVTHRQNFPPLYALSSVVSVKQVSFYASQSKRVHPPFPQAIFKLLPMTLMLFKCILKCLDE